ncbi:MAG TPA: AMP-binding protein [Gammaproteobacteria bacterium]|nr:AMP-binding protein [Gammaproteobacteria bacterium]
MADNRKDRTRRVWLETMQRYQRDPGGPGSRDYWSPTLDCASRDELVAIQNAKLAALTPYLYENSGFYRRRFDQLGMAPTDIRTVEDLAEWPVVDKEEMMRDAMEHPPWGTYTAMDDELWRRRGWMLFSSSGSTGVPRVFRYSQIDRGLWSWANARAIHSFGIRPSDSMLICAGYGPHVFAWGIQYAAALMNVAVIPGGGMNSDMRAMLVERYRPTVLVSTPSYALYLGRVLEEKGMAPARSSVNYLLLGGEPAAGVESTRRRLEALWRARVVEFYGCTEVSPHCGGYSCPASDAGDGPVTSHLMEDIQIWETVDPDTREPLPAGERGLTVCTSLNSEASPQLRFLVGDYTRLDEALCPCGRSHVRAVGAFAGRADDLINLRGLKMYPVEIEHAVRTVPGIGDEYQIVLRTDKSGLDVMTLRVEHRHGEAIAPQVERAVQTHCEVRAGVEVLAPGTLPKTEFKAKRVRDQRG